MKRILFLSLIILLFSSCGSSRNRMDKFIDELMGRMTLQDKIGQLNMVAVGKDIVTGPEVKADVAELLKNNALGSVLNIRGAEKVRTLQQYAVDSSSLHIPLLFGLDIVHGYMTQMPIPLGISASWDENLARRTAEISVSEACCDGINWTFAPMVDICHDARWGRISEGSGEDPYLGSRFAEAYVKGFQDGTGNGKAMMACLKHYAAYGAPTGGLDYTAVDMSRAHLWNYYMEPYKAAIEAGCKTVMTSFSEIDGVPGTANSYLLKDVLRGEWGFDGLVVSDYNGVSELCAHGLGDKKTAAARALSAGVDVDMCSSLFVNTIEESVKDGKLSLKEIDNACRRVLEAKYELGLFEDPYKFCNPHERDSVTCCGEFLEDAKRIAMESFVLLKNKNGILPLRKDMNIALIGPYAVESENMLGNWFAAGKHAPVVPISDGISRLNSGTLRVEAGCDICYDENLQKNWCWLRPVERLEDSAEANRAKALKAASGADVIVAAMGEPAYLSGEGASRTDIRIPDSQRDLLKELVSTGKPVVLVLFNGRPLDLSWEAENVDAILEVWFPGSGAGDAIAETLFGEFNPCGKLPVSFPRCVGQLPYYYNHTKSARQADEFALVRNRTKYLDSPISPLYPFGYGLSYTSFEYGEPEVAVSEDTVTVKVNVQNTGRIAGKEVVQLYIRDCEASVSRPVRQLAGYRKLLLQPSEHTEVLFKLYKEDLSFYDAEGKRVFEPGKFIAMIGGDSNNVRKASFIMNNEQK